MPRLPQRLGLSAQAAEIIKEMIDNQELKNLLPGERTLAANLQIGRDTLRAALEILEAEKWIAPREHGKRRTIIRAPGSKEAGRRSRTQRVAYLSPKRLEQLPPDMLLEVDHVRALLNKQGYEVEFHAPGIFHLRNPARKLEQLLHDKQADAWMLYQCPPPVQAWFEEQNIPALVRGYPHPGITLPSLDEDWFDHLIPSITHYHLEAQTIARSVVRKLLQIISGVSTGKPVTLLIPECIPGHSVRKRG